MEELFPAEENLKYLCDLEKKKKAYFSFVNWEKLKYD